MLPAISGCALGHKTGFALFTSMTMLLFGKLGLVNQADDMAGLYKSFGMHGAGRLNPLRCDSGSYMDAAAGVVRAFHCALRDVDCEMSIRSPEFV
jgi:hypothetical protein